MVGIREDFTGMNLKPSNIMFRGTWDSMFAVVSCIMFCSLQCKL